MKQKPAAKPAASDPSRPPIVELTRESEVRAVDAAASIRDADRSERRWQRVQLAGRAMNFTFGPGTDPNLSNKDRVIGALKLADLMLMEIDANGVSS